MAYIADIFTYINETITSLQGNKITFFKAQGMILALKRKINLWKKCILGGKYECFKHLCEHHFSKQLALQENVKICISQHLPILDGQHFVLHNDTFFWIQNPFRDFLKM